MLEYYPGVLFLTTNRIGDFDEAFASRIHISLYYPPLTRESTKKVFELNLWLIRNRITNRGVEIDIDRKGILQFAARYWRRHKGMRWNGRQIRNACQTALALAEYDAQRGTLEKLVDAKAEIGKVVDKTAKVHLTVEKVETVARAYLEFMRYLKEVYNRDAEARAKSLGIRAREFVPLDRGSDLLGGLGEADLAEDEEDSEEDSEEEEEEEEGEEENGREAFSTVGHQNTSLAPAEPPGANLQPGMPFPMFFSPPALGQPQSQIAAAQIAEQQRRYAEFTAMMMAGMASGAQPLPQQPLPQPQASSSRGQGKAPAGRKAKGRRGGDWV